MLTCALNDDNVLESESIRLAVVSPKSRLKRPPSQHKISPFCTAFVTCKIEWNEGGGAYSEGTKELLELPQIINESLPLELSSQEKQQYLETRKRLIRQINQNCLQPNQKGYLGVFQLQLQLRRLCNHGAFQKPTLGVEEFDPEQAIAELKKQRQATCASCNSDITGIHVIEEQRSGSFTVCGHLLCSKCAPRLRQGLRTIDGRDGCFKCPLCSETIFGEYMVMEEDSTKPPKRGTKHLSAWQYFNRDSCSRKISALVADIEKHMADESKR